LDFLLFEHQKIGPIIRLIAKKT